VIAFERAIEHRAARHRGYPGRQWRP